MFYVIGTEDVYIRSLKIKKQNDETSLLSKKNAFKTWLDKGKDQELEEKARALYS
jgi:hypothetical protein